MNEITEGSVWRDKVRPLRTLRVVDPNRSGQRLGVPPDYVEVVGLANDAGFTPSNGERWGSPSWLKGSDLLADWEKVD